MTMNMEPNQTQPTNPAHASASTGTIVVLVIILALIVGGAVYVWKDHVASLPPEAQVESLETQGDSTEASAIEADLAAESSDEFDEDFDQAFTELDAAFEAE